MATACPTTSSSTTSALTSSKAMATTLPTSTNSSKSDCADEAGRSTSTLVGDATVKPSLMQAPMPKSSQMRWKHNMELESSSDSNTSDTSSSSAYASRNKRKRNASMKKEIVPTDNHLQIRAVCDAGRKWELDLERVNGLTDEEACVCVSIVAKNLPKDEFPHTKGDRFVELAREGWKNMKESDRLLKLYPECGNQTCIHGEWIMLRE